jgi:hypothetical protein
MYRIIFGRIADYFQMVNKEKSNMVIAMELLLSSRKVLSETLMVVVNMVQGLTFSFHTQ